MLPTIIVIGLFLSGCAGELLSSVAVSATLVTLTDEEHAEYLFLKEHAEDYRDFVLGLRDTMILHCDIDPNPGAIASTPRSRLAIARLDVFGNLDCGEIL